MSFRSAKWLSLAAALALTTACAKDSDEDGLLDKEEEDLGTDPLAVDSDGDGISDADEVTMGIDPLGLDSDGDGYQDGHEIDNRRNPADPESRIYEGYWPYNPDKDSISDPGWDGGTDEGDTLPRFAWLDQHGEVVDIYDFAFQGKPIIFDLSEYRCYWCEETAKMLEGEPSEFDQYGADTDGDGQVDADYIEIAELVETGAVYWVTVIDGDFATGADVDEDLIDKWMNKFPMEHIPVLMDEERKVADWLNIQGYPTMVLLEEDMTIAVNPEIYVEVWDEVLARHADGAL